VTSGLFLGAHGEAPHRGEYISSVERVSDDTVRLEITELEDCCGVDVDLTRDEVRRLIALLTQEADRVLA